MVLKQRFADGKTHYIYIGNSWLYIQPASPLWPDEIESYFKDAKSDGCVGFIQYEKETEPIFDCYPQWIYSDDGKLFMTLV